MKYKNILEEEIKNRVALDFFQAFDCTRILGKIDFAVKIKRPQNAADFNDEYLLWAEAKQKSADILAMLAQLVLTVGKARTFDEILPPPFLGCYDNEKIAFVPYSEIQDIFYRNDFNWKVTPSDTATKEFQQIYGQIKKVVENDISRETYLFHFDRDEKELRRFIRENFIVGKSDTTKIKINKNNFITIYNKWFETVKPTIQIDRWDLAKKSGIIDGDFYLADILSAENKTLKEKLFVLLKSDHYELDRKIDETGFKNFKTTAFSDNQKAHVQFWAKYQRPPHEDYWDYIVERRDLLVPQDVRERKGSFFTPKIWVELSQKYMADVLGEEWQDEYTVWDCAAGTGNLLAGLTNKYNIWASTLDKQDVDVMHDRIKNGANLLESHVFQFDFLNDDFSKLPEGLRKIIDSLEARKKLVIYINPPYAEDTTKFTISGTGKNKISVARNRIHDKYAYLLKKANHELFVQFLIRIYCEIPTAKIANFSKLKNLQSSNFVDFRNAFQAKLEKIFLIPADTFDNVTGQFPIGFFIWNTEITEKFTLIHADVYDKNGKYTRTKSLYANDDIQTINKWIKRFKDDKNEPVGLLVSCSPDFQHNNQVAILSEKQARYCFPITRYNIVEFCIYFSVRKVVSADWLNDRDQFLYPNKKWEKDTGFHNDCLTYTLFNNNISSKNGVNHWIPFSENEVNARDKFESHFIISFLSGKVIKNGYANLFDPDYLADVKKNKLPAVNWEKGKKREFSTEAQAVFTAGKELWKYYHAQPGCNVNASLYDIREHFQGRNDKGKMNSKSDNEQYAELIGNLRASLKILAGKIEPKVYEYGFLK